RLADYRALTDVELRTRWEPPHGLFIAEGELVLRRAPATSSGRSSSTPSVSTSSPTCRSTRTNLRRLAGPAGERHRISRSPRRPRLLPAQALPALADILGTARRVAVLEDLNNHTKVRPSLRSMSPRGELLRVHQQAVDPAGEGGLKV